MMDEDKVVRLDGKSLDVGEPVVYEELIERLEHLLVKAREGRLQSFAIAALTDDEGYATCWSIRPDGNPTTLTGAVARLQSRLCRVLEDLAGEGEV